MAATIAAVGSVCGLIMVLEPAVLHNVNDGGGRVDFRQYNCEYQDRLKISPPRPPKSKALRMQTPPAPRQLLTLGVHAALCLFLPAGLQGQAPVPPPIAEIDKWVEASMDRWDVPGLGLAIVYEGESYLATGYGVKELGSTAPVDGGTLFSIGSCSKAFGAATLAALVEEGELSWDDRIVEHLPWFQLHDPWTTREIRVRDIVTHRVGTGSNQPLRPLVTSRRDYLSRLPHTEPDHAFRDRYGYTNDMLVLTGELVETVTGGLWDDYAQQALWAPLGMNSTTSRMTRANASPNHAEPHALVQRRFQGNAATPGMAIEAVPWQYPEDVTVPSGGVISSAEDMTQWIRFQVGTHAEAPLSRASVEMMHTPHTVIQEPTSWMPFEGPGAYAMGWSTGSFGSHTVVGHGGNALGFNCSITLVPEHRFGVWATTNRNSELPWVLTKWAVARFLGDEESRNRDFNAEHGRSVAEGNKRAAQAEAERKAARLDQGPTVPLAAFEGVYHNGYAGTLRIRLTEHAPSTLMPAEGRMARWDATPGVHERATPAASEENATGAMDNGTADGPLLVLSLDGRERPLEMPLEPWHLNQFYAWYGDVQIGVRFRLDQMAQVEGVELDYYGLFKRIN